MAPVPPNLNSGGYRTSVRSRGAFDIVFAEGMTITYINSTGETVPMVLPHGTRLRLMAGSSLRLGNSARIITPTVGHAPATTFSGLVASASAGGHAPSSTGDTSQLAAAIAAAASSKPKAAKRARS